MSALAVPWGDIRRHNVVQGVDNLVQASINRYSVLMKKEYIKASNRTQISCIGNIEGNIRIISSSDTVLSRSMLRALRNIPEKF